MSHLHQQQRETTSVELRQYASRTVWRGLLQEYLLGRDLLMLGALETKELSELWLVVIFIGLQVDWR